MNTTAVKAALLALSSQGIALAVGYGVLNNAQAGKWTAVSVGVLNAVFLVVHAWHEQTDSRARTDRIAARRTTTTKTSVSK